MHGKQWYTDSSSSAFFEPEGGKESTEDPLSGRSSNLLSLIFGEEKAGSTARSEQSRPHSLVTVSQPANEQIKANALSTSINSPEGSCSEEKMSAVPPVLTCEDLENSILSEFSEEGGPKVEEHLEIQEIPDAKTKQQRTDIDNHASQHLLSLLQKGGLEDILVSPNKGTKLSEHSENRHSDGFSGLHNTEAAAAAISQKFHNVRQTLTLETLFGSAFMKALPAVEPGISNDHPKVLQRLFEMELRSKGKPENPFHAAAAIHGQGLYGHDLDSRFRYR